MYTCSFDDCSQPPQCIASRSMRTLDNSKCLIDQENNEDDDNRG